MYKKFVLLIVGMFAVLAVLVFFIVKMVLGNRELLIPIFFIIAYILLMVILPRLSLLKVMSIGLCFTRILEY
jgi:hypothetical protein